MPGPENLYLPNTDNDPINDGITKRCKWARDRNMLCLPPRSCATDRCYDATSIHGNHTFREQLPDHSHRVPLSFAGKVRAFRAD